MQRIRDPRTGHRAGSRTGAFGGACRAGLTVLALAGVAAAGWIVAAPANAVVGGQSIARPVAVGRAAPPAGASAPAASTAHATAVPASPRLLLLGDSITYGIGSSNRAGYRADLADRLTAAGVSFDFVGSQHTGPGPDNDHEGHPGWRIDQITARVDTWMSRSAPDIVLLNIGTNDYVQNHGTAVAPARLSDLLDRILSYSPRVRVVVAKLLVIDGAQRARGVAAFNAMLPRVVATKGPRVTIADMSRISRKNTRDGIHPTNLGYRQMSHQWYEALRGVLDGRQWPQTANPFPVPSVELLRSTAVVPKGQAVTLTARLGGALTATDLGRVPVQLLYRRLGSSSWRVLRTASTASDGTVTFRQQMTRAGRFAARIAAGRAAGRCSATVRVDTLS